ncbi:hypothetical protein K502DRAFT_340168 [Neoconidiobolus thromboides FSU 785]|nr:hypothetical protein K502DRAFT_340168 [Neoconidiobolus thromboides FSU 785]
MSYNNTNPTVNIYQNPNYNPNPNTSQDLNYNSHPTSNQSSNYNNPTTSHNSNYANNLNSASTREVDTEREHRNPLQLQEAISTFFPSITSKSSDELFTLLTIESEFLEYFNSLPEVINQRINLQDFQLGNEELAMDNLSMEGKYLSLKEAINQKGQVIEELEHKFQMLKRRESELSSKYNPKQYIPKLKQEKSNLDQKAMELSEQFLNGNMEMEAYLQEYKKLRTEYHHYDILLQNSNHLKTVDLNENPISFLR